MLAAVSLVEREPERRERLWENTRFMKAELNRLGFDTGDSESPVIPDLGRLRRTLLRSGA